MVLTSCSLLHGIVPAGGKHGDMGGGVPMGGKGDGGFYIGDGDTAAGAAGGFAFCFSSPLVLRSLSASVPPRLSFGTCLAMPRLAAADEAIRLPCTSR